MEKIDLATTSPNGIKNMVVADQRVKMPEISGELMSYIFNRTTVCNAELSDVTNQSKSEQWGFMNTCPDQAQFLNMLVKISGSKKILEIGSFLGHSAIAMASALNTQGILTSVDCSEIWSAKAKENYRKAGVISKIQQKIGPALEIMDSLRVGGETYDLIFIDADKANVVNYYQRAVELVEVGGLIIIDNVLWRGNIHKTNDCERSKALNELNDLVMEDDRTEGTILTLSDGMWMIRRL